MASFLVTAVLAVSSARLVASQTQQTTWGTVILSLHGERTPEIADAFPYTTPLGAQQALAAGSAIRTRYIEGPGTNVTNSYPIPGLEVNTIDNIQLYLLARDDDYIAGSAQAFMQGVYPPLGSAYVDQESILANGTLIQYPLGGYQYPTIDTISPLDFNYVWIAGDNDCNQYSLAATTYIGSVDYNLTSIATLPMYQRLTPLLFQNVVPQSFVDYYNAYDLWEYANYLYTHNKTIYEQLDPGDLAQLRALASQQAFHQNGDLSVSGLTQGDRILAISGQTYAAHVLSLLGQTIGSQGVAEKLSVLFSRYEVFLAFFSLSDLSESNNEFTQIPLPGSVMIFELFSNMANASSFPDTGDLWVRFLFRNGTDPSTPLVAYSLFGRGNSATDMTWADFETNMNSIKLAEIGTWCETCGSLAMYCTQFEDNWNSSTTSNSSSSSSSTSTTSSSGISPTVAGVLGAVVTIAAFVLFFSLAVLCGGVRFYRNGSKRQSTLGGFKGAEKLASDTDLTVAKSEASGAVVRHERVGSWELSDAAKKDDDSKQQSLDRVVSTADYSKQDDDGISVVSPFGEPVKADERV